MNLPQPASKWSITPVTRKLSQFPPSLPPFLFSFSTALSSAFAVTVIALFMITQSRQTQIKGRGEPVFSVLIDDHRVKFGPSELRPRLKGVRRLGPVCIMLQRKPAFV